MGLYSEIPPGGVERAHLEPLEDVGAAVAASSRGVGPGAAVAVLPRRPMTIPYLAG